LPTTLKKRILLFLLLAGKLFAQTGNLGLPPISNFPKTIYHAGTQNWDIAQDAQGRVLFANNEGLLVFDGANWQLFPIGNKTCVRSLAVAPDGKIFVGGQGEIGYFMPDLTGNLRYFSLNPLILSEKSPFTDIWDIVISKENTVYFRCAERLFEFKNGQIHGFSNGSNFVFLGKLANDKILIQDEKNGLQFFDGSHFTPISANKIDGIVTAILPIGGDSTLLTTLKNGIFLLKNDQISNWTTPIDPFLKEKRIYSASMTQRGELVIGTSYGGMIVLNRYRQPVQWLQQSEGLLNSNVLFVACDRAQNLWLGLDSGISHVETSSPFYRIFPDGNLEGTGYAARFFAEKLYLGTTNGLFFKPFGNYFDPFQKENFKVVSGSTGQVWGLDEANGSLLMGHHEGPFMIKNGQAIRVSDDNGTWKFLEINDSLLVAGQYAGLSFFTKNKNNAWQFKQKLPNFQESSRILAHEKGGNLWVSHPYRGVFQIDFKENKEKNLLYTFGKSAGLPSDLNNYVFEIGGKILVAAEKGIFRFDAMTKRFVEMPELNQSLAGSGRVRFLKNDDQGNIWFCKGEETGVLWVEDLGFGKKIRRQIFPQLAGQMVGGFEHIYPMNDENVFFAVEKGFLHLNIDRLHQADTSVNVLISSVFLTNSGDSLLASGFSDLKTTKLPFLQNSLRFGFAAPIFGSNRQPQFSCKMEGLEKNWSVWNAKTEREFPHLAAGDYVFWVKARNEFGVESAPARFAFTIKSPWYSSIWARIFYVGLLVLGVIAFFSRQKRHFETEKTSLTDEHRRQSDAQEQELARLQNEKLAAEVTFKNQELALATMHLVQKGEILSGIQDELGRALDKNSDQKSLRDDLNRIVRTLQIDERADEDWAHFAIHFDSVHGDFLKILREKYPQLTANDHQLCAYLRMNLTTKEIANLLHISVRGVEGSRYRLRKKMGLAGDANLGEVMNSL
jgi:DNA-binding CsgD family transcriptional regulator